MLENNTLHKGDCIDLLSSIDDNSIDLLLIDPPYYTPAKISATKTQFRRSLGNYGIFDSWVGAYFRQIERIMKLDGHMYIFCDSRTYPIFWLHTYDYLKDNRALVWDKGRAFMGYSWRRQYELILFGQMPEAKPVKSGEGDVLKAPVVPVGDRSHPAEKPVPLLKRLIEKSSKQGDLVLDTFCGTGSSLIAAKETGRNYIGFDFSEEYLNVAEKRLLNSNTSDTIFNHEQSGN